MVAAGRLRVRLRAGAVARLATVRLTRSDKRQAPIIDLLFASSGIEPEVVAEAESIELLPNLTIGVARTGHLIALKVLSRDDVTRPQAWWTFERFCASRHRPSSLGHDNRSR